eukprot:6462387-Prymnesium_polylepis.1
MNSESTAPADHLQRSAAQQVTGCGALLQRPPWSRAGRERSIGPPVSTRRARARRNQAVHGVVSAAPP